MRDWVDLNGHRHPSAADRSAIRSSTFSMPTESRTSVSPMPSVGAHLGWHRAVRHQRRMLDQALDAAEAFGQREQPAAFEETARIVERPVEFGRDHAAEGAHLLLRQRVLGVARQTRDRTRGAPWDAVPARRRSASADAQWRSIRNASVLRPRSARNESNGPWMAPTAFCRNASRSRSSSLVPTIATPPTMSEWPLRYFVVECTTRSKPYSSGLCT